MQVSSKYHIPVNKIDSRSSIIQTIVCQYETNL